MVGINGSEFIVLAVLVVLLVGPERMPEYAEQLGRLVRTGRKYFDAARKRVDEEIGDEIKDVDWTRLDPRQYDPRRIVRDALLDDPAATAQTATTRAAAVSGTASVSSSAARRPAAPGSAADDAGARLTAGSGAPYDDEAT